MGYRGNGAHGAIVYRGYGVQVYRPHGKWAMGHMDNGTHGAIVYRGYRPHGLCGTEDMAHMGNGVQGVCGTWAMGYRSMRHMGNGVQGVWGTGV